MDTTTLLVVIGCGVLVKTLAFVGFVVRRERRQRRSLAAAGAARDAANERVTRLASASVKPGAALSSWRFQWSEPGLLLIENASEDEAARDVELAATLTTSGGLVASLVRHERFVGTGATFVARFEELAEWLDETVLLDPDERLVQLTCSLDLELTWTDDHGVPHSENWLAQPVVPVPDLALERA